MVGRKFSKLWSIGGGKGGIGKSIFTLGLGISLARLGKKVILIDADLGGANLHTLMGVRYPAFSMEDFILKRVGRLEDIIIDTPIDGIGLICGADDILGAANPKYVQKLRLLNQMEDLPADFVLLDLGAGTSFNVLDFFNYSPARIALITNQATSLQNVYGFLKSALFRLLSREFTKDQLVLGLLYQTGSKNSPTKIDSIHDLLAQLQEIDQGKHDRMLHLVNHFKIFLVVNMVKSDLDFKAAQIIQKVSADFLGLDTKILGHLVYDAAVEEAVNQMLPFPLHHEDSQAAAGLDRIARQILEECQPSTPPRRAVNISPEKTREVDSFRQSWPREAV